MVTVVNRPQKELLGKVIIQSTLTVETGLHIGGGGETLNIGGIDKPVIRDPLTQQPYLPGSSLKGKLRATLERLLKKPLNRGGGSGTYRYESDDLVDGFSEVGRDQFVYYDGARTCPLSRVFGSTGGSKCWIEESLAKSEGLIEPGDTSERKSIENRPHVKVKGRNSPARLIVRDCHLQKESAEKLGQIDSALYMTEWKFENGIDRVTAAANPRQLERVPAGAQFQFEMVYTVEDQTQAVEDLQNLAIALAILEDDALGGHGSRGYGKVRFEQFEFYYRGVNQYLEMARGNTSLSTQLMTAKDTQSLLNNFSQLSTQVTNLLPSGDTE
ncbi:MAG: type III-A CRISPR-associated RAMP protein Csm3 [Cyanobacteria bacterium J06643_4]